MPMLLGQFVLGFGLFVMVFGVCWMALGPVFLLVAGVVDLSRAIERTLERRKGIGTGEAGMKAGHLAVITDEPRGILSVRVPPRYMS